MTESERLQKKADHLCELAVILQEVREILFEEAKHARFNAGLQWQHEQRDATRK